VAVFTLFFGLLWAKLGHCGVDMSIIATIESGGNPEAYNKSSGAVGKYQLLNCVVKDYNKRFKSAYTLADMYEPDVALVVANWYMNIEIPRMLKYYHRADTTDNRLWAYNAGIGNLVKGRKPLETRAYIIKYHKLEGRIKK